MKKLPVGIHSFAELRAGDFYFVDKTAHIKDALESWPHGSLFSRPHHFGKTLFLEALARFLEIDPENPGSAKKNAELFSGLKILEDKDFCEAHMGQYPVIFFSLKSVTGKTFDEAYIAFANVMQGVARQFPYLLESSKLSVWDKREIARFVSDGFFQSQENRGSLKASLRDLIAMLSLHFGREVFVLIDDVDAPLKAAAANGYYSDIHDFLLLFLDCALYPGCEHAMYLKKALLTGTLRPIDEELIVTTDLYKLMFETVLSRNLDSCDVFGFTGTEVKALLRDCGLSSRFDDVRGWYGGYRIAERELYTPESIVRFCKKTLDSKEPVTFNPTNEWIGSESDDALDHLFNCATREDLSNIERLINGDAINLSIEVHLRYPDVLRDCSSFSWTYLLYMGYLTVAQRDSQDAYRFKLKIPNEEMREIFKKKANKFFTKEAVRANFNANEVAKLLSNSRRRV